MRLWLLSKSKVAKPKPIREGTLGRDAQRAPFREEGRWGAARRVPCEHLTIHRAGGTSLSAECLVHTGRCGSGRGDHGEQLLSALKTEADLGQRWSFLFRNFSLSF